MAVGLVSSWVDAMVEMTEKSKVVEKDIPKEMPKEMKWEDSLVERLEQTMDIQ